MENTIIYEIKLGLDLLLFLAKLKSFYENFKLQLVTIFYSLARMLNSDPLVYASSLLKEYMQKSMYCSGVIKFIQNHRYCYQVNKFCSL